MQANLALFTKWGQQNNSSLYWSHISMNSPVQDLTFFIYILGLSINGVMNNQNPNDSGKIENQNQNLTKLEKIDNQGEFPEDKLFADKEIDD